MSKSDVYPFDFTAWQQTELRKPLKTEGLKEELLQLLDKLGASIGDIFLALGYEDYNQIDLASQKTMRLLCEAERLACIMTEMCPLCRRYGPNDPAIEVGTLCGICSGMASRRA